jgi:molybdopterin molybdotransferase/putative molybdopterin biosynthesis protein
MISFREAQRIVSELASSLRSSHEKIKTRDAVGRILYKAIFALRSNPTCDVAAMDGIAVNTSYQVSLRFNPGEWQRVNTGDPISNQWNAVVKIEDVEFENEIAIVSKPISPMQHIRLKGEDFSKDALLFSPDHKIQPPDVSLLLTAGYEEIEVLKKPIIAFLPTGSELVMQTSTQKEGQVLESNSAMIDGLAASWGSVLRILQPVNDDYESLKLTIRKAIADSDVVVVSAGTSMGTRDLTASVIQELGEILFHGVALQPAKPTLLGKIGDVPILGLPGYPVAAYVASLYFLQPLVTAISRNIPQSRREVLISAENLSAKNADSIHRVNFYDVDGRVYVRKISRGAGSIMSLSQMDGLMHVPADTEIHKRDAVRIDVIHDHAVNSLAILGVSDPILNRAWDLFKEASPQQRILFWENPPEDALQNIIERNCHMAIINTFTGYDLFPEFARQLQDNMLRYRIFSRTVALVAQEGGPPCPPKLVVPVRNQSLWSHHPESSKYQSLVVNLSDAAAIRWVETQSDAGVFADIRFLKADRNKVWEVQEHFDLIVSETYAETPRIRKLIDLMLSPQYGDWIESIPGCTAASRGLLHETYDI